MASAHLGFGRAEGERTAKIQKDLYGIVRMELSFDKWPVNKAVKLGKEQAWKTRFFVLAENLCYYADEATYRAGKKPKGVLALDFAAISRHAEPTKIQIRTSDKSLLLRFRDQAQAEAWFHALKSVQSPHER